MICWCNFYAVLLSGSALSLIGFLVVTVVSLSISWPIVALNNMVWTYWLQFFIIYFISASKPNYRSLSASSKTIIYNFYIPMLLEFTNRPKIRPGVPITNPGLFLRDDYCFWIELAPIAKVAYKFVNLF